MNILWGIFGFLCFIVSTVTWCRLSRPDRMPAWVIFLFVFLTAQIVTIAYILSVFNRLASRFWWVVSGFSLAGLAVLVSVFWPPSPGLLLSHWYLFLKSWWRALSAWERIVLRIVLATVAVAGLLNAGVVLFSATHTWDNMVYRLARVAYYLQHGNLGYFDANSVQQVVVQKNCSILMLFSFIASGYNENLAQLWQFFAYWTAVACVFGISREIGLKRSAALLAAGIFALLTVCLMQSTTAQSDMLLAAYAGCSVYSLLSYRNRSRPIFLIVSAISICMGFGVKASFLLLVPSLVLIAGYVFIRRGPSFDILGLSRLVFLVLLALLIVTFPSAYWSNYRIFNNPLGPEEWRKVNSYQGETLAFIIAAGAKHLLRNGFDFLTFDGFPPLPLIWDAQNALRYLPRTLTAVVGIDLEQNVVQPWFYYPPPHSHEDYSSWGILGWTLVWPALLLVAAGVKKRRLPAILAFGALLFIVIHSFIGIYDFGGRARYLLPATVLALPAAGWWFYVRSRALKTWLTIFIALGCVSALTAVLFRYRSPVWFDQSVFLRGRLTTAQEEAWPLPLRPGSIFHMDRLSQVIRDIPIYDEPIRNFEYLVPPDAEVAVALNSQSLEYPLFGRKLTRKILPINSFFRGLQPIPLDADYLLWVDDFNEIFNRSQEDIHLGKDWWLRRLR